MREIEGFVCIADKDTSYILYGQSKNVQGQAFENITTNGLSPFQTYEAAVRARDEIIQKIKLEKVDISEIEVQIAETIEEIDLLNPERGFVVMVQSEERIEFIGEHDKKNSLVTIPGSLIQQNGLKPFSKVADARWVASEAIRQKQSPATITQISLTKI